MSLRIGIIGCGGIGKTHIAAWSAAGHPPVAVCDTVSELAHAAATTCQAAVYTDVETFLHEAKVDIVSICTPPASHHDLVIRALHAGMHVLCEKPFAPTVAECDAMIAASETHQRLLSVGFCHRFQPHVESMKTHMDAGLIGDIIMFRNRFAGHMPNVETRWFSNPALAGGGVIMDTSVHSVDLFRHLIGDVARVQASSTTRTTELGPALAVEDTAVTLLTSTSGVIGVIEASWRTPPGEWVVTVYGTRGTLTLDYDSMQLWHIDAQGTKHQIDVPDGDRFTNEVRAFAESVQHGVPLRVTAHDGRAATDILVRAMHDAGRTSA